MKGAYGVNCPFCEYAARLERVIDGGQALEGNLLDYFIFDGVRVMMLKPMSPVTRGHVMFVPVQHTPAAMLMATSAQADTLVKAGAACMAAAATHAIRMGQSYNLVLQAGEAGGQSVEHFHLHYVPRERGDGFGYRWKGQH